MVGRLGSAILVLAGLTAAAAMAPTMAAAHDGGEPAVIVPLDHVRPGERFQILLTDFTAGSSVRVELGVPTGSVVLAEAMPGPDGHAEAAADLPTDLSFGYLEVTAVADDGATAKTWIRVGDAAYASPRTAPGSSWMGLGGVILVILGVMLGAALAILVGRARRNAR